MKRIKAFRMLQAMEGVEKYRFFYNFYGTALPPAIRRFLKNFIDFYSKLQTIRVTIGHGLTPPLSDVLDLLSYTRFLMTESKEFVEKYSTRKDKVTVFNKFLEEIKDHLKYLNTTDKNYENRVARIVTIAGEIEALLKSGIDDFMEKYLIGFEAYFNPMLTDFADGLVLGAIPPLRYEERLEELRRVREMKEAEKEFEELFEEEEK